jgi:hypothetical protein
MKIVIAFITLCLLVLHAQCNEVQDLKKRIVDSQNDVIICTKPDVATMSSLEGIPREQLMSTFYQWTFKNMVNRIPSQISLDEANDYLVRYLSEYKTQLPLLIQFYETRLQRQNNDNENERLKGCLIVAKSAVQKLYDAIAASPNSEKFVNVQEELEKLGARPTRVRHMQNNFLRFARSAGTNKSPFSDLIITNTQGYRPRYEDDLDDEYDTHEYYAPRRWRLKRRRYY